MSRLIKQLIDRIMEIKNQNELNHDYPKSIWHFYQIYNICSAIIGYEDNDISKKNKLMKQLMLSSNKNINFSVQSKLNKYISEDIQVINLAMEIIREQSGGGEIFGDFDRPDCVAIQIDDGI